MKHFHKDFRVCTNLFETSKNKDSCFVILFVIPFVNFFFGRGNKLINLRPFPSGAVPTSRLLGEVEVDPNMWKPLKQHPIIMCQRVSTVTYTCICMYMCVYACLCMYTYVYVCIHMYMYVYVCVYKFKHTYLYLSLSLYIYAVHMIFRVANGTTSAVPRFDVQVLKKNTNIVLTFILDHSWFFGIALTMNFVFVPFFFPCISVLPSHFQRIAWKFRDPPGRPGLEAKAEAWKVPSMPIQIEDKQAVEAAHAAATASCP